MPPLMTAGPDRRGVNLPPTTAIGVFRQNRIAAFTAGTVIVGISI
jgi:hypothetical protein